MTTRRMIDRTNIDYLYLKASMMSNESLREYAAGRGTWAAVARRELAERDLAVGLTGV